MSVATIHATQQAIDQWEGGQQSLLELIAAHVVNAPNDASAKDAFSDALATLVTSLTTTLGGGTKLGSASLVAFLHALAVSLPSTSNVPIATILVDVLADVIFTVDSTLEESLAEAKTAVNGSAEDPSLNSHLSSLVEDKRNISMFIQELIRQSIVKPSVFRDHLDFPLLCSSGLLVDEQAWARKEVRVRTAAFYKQNKFNLLREQSEGYSKLTTEVISLIGPPHSPLSGSSIESISSIKHRAHIAWNKVISLIGYFELDPYRALDVILDVFSSHVIAHYSFFLELLKCSKWIRAPEEVALEEMALDPVEDSLPAGEDGVESFEDLLSHAECKATRTSKPSDDSLYSSDADVPVCAQILGFKFVHYQTSVPSPETTPQQAFIASKELYLTTAVLIREGFMKLSDVYPHLSPPDEDLAQLEKKEIEAAGKKLKAPPRVNALTQATALETSYSRSRHTNTVIATTESQGDNGDGPPPAPAPPLPNQKLGLVHALLSIGALRPALKILAKFPWIVQAHGDIADLVLKLVEVAISPVSQSLSFSSRHPQYADSNSRSKARRQPLASQPSAPPIRYSLTALTPEPISTHNQHFTFFYPNWSSWVPRCTTFDDVVTIVFPFLKLLGTQIHRDVTLIARLCKIGVSMAKADTIDGSNVVIPSIWVDVLRLYLVPSLSLIRINSVISSSVWSLLSLCSPEDRWAIYDEWRSLSKGTLRNRKNPFLQLQAQESSRETKDILRRLTNNSQGNMFSVPISKLSHSNPVIVLEIALQQGTAYANFPKFLADSMEYLTPLELDCLTWLVLRVFVDPARDRLKADGTSLSDWVQNLAQFTGKLLRNHQSMDPELILQYVIHRLRDNDAKELVILREVIISMTSIAPLENLNDKQVLALGGGPLYRVEMISATTRGSRSGALHAANTAGEKRLIGALMRTKMALPMLIAVAQTRASSIYRVSDAEWHPKYLSGLYDECQAVLMQYVEFLTQALGPEYGSLLPSLGDLCNSYGLEPSIAFHILRPMLYELVTKYNVEVLAQIKQAKELDMKEKVRANLAARTAGVTPGDTPSPGVISPPSNISALPMTPTLPSPAVPPPPVWAPCLLPLMDQARDILPQRVQEVLGVQFFVSFWQMSLADIGPPINEYTELRKSLSDYVQSRPSPSLSSAEYKFEAFNRVLAERVNIALPIESRSNLEAYEASRTRLQREKPEWFKNSIAIPGFSHSELISQMLQHCLIPRLLLSPADAEYCGRMIKIMHKVGTPGFSSAHCYNKLLGDQTSSFIFSCTDHEIENYSRFLKVILADLNAWHSSEDTYSKDCKLGNTNSYLPGFQKKWSNDKVSLQDLYTWTHFKGIVENSIKKFAKNLLRCLTTNEYMHVRNTIKVLSDILPVFPLKSISPAVGPALESVVRQYKEDARDDIKTIATGYHNRLVHFRSQWQVPDPEALPPPKPEVKVEVVKSEAPSNGLPAKPVSSQSAEVKSRDTMRLKPNGIAQLPANPTLARQSPHPTGVATPPSNNTAAPAPRGLEGISSIPRPEIIKRNRAERQDSPRSAPSNMAMDIDQKDRLDGMHAEAASAGNDGSSTSRPPSPGARHIDKRRDHPSRRDDTSRPSQGMPPPAAPSSRPTAQELRASSKQSLRTEKSEPTSNGTYDAPRSPRGRSISPPRNTARSGSADSRSSAPDDRARSERSAGGERDREKEREGDRERRSSSRRDAEREARRDRGRDRDTISERDKERSGRNRNRDRDAERDRTEERTRRDQTTRRDREKEIPTGPSGRSSRRDDERGSSRNDASSLEDSSHKRRRGSEDESGPSKRLKEAASREHGRDPARDRERDTTSTRETRRSRNESNARDIAKEVPRDDRGGSVGRDPVVIRDTSKDPQRDRKEGIPEAHRDRDSAKDIRVKDKDEGQREDKGRRDRDKLDRDRDRDGTRDRHDETSRSSRSDRSRRDRDVRAETVQDLVVDTPRDDGDSIDKNGEKSRSNTGDSRANNKLAQNAFKSISGNNPPSGPRAMASGDTGGRPPPAPRGPRGNPPRINHQDSSRSLMDRIGPTSTDHSRNHNVEDQGTRNGAGLSLDARSSYSEGAGMNGNHPRDSGAFDTYGGASPGARKRSLGDRTTEPQNMLSGSALPSQPSNHEPLIEKPQPPKRSRVNRQGNFASRMENH